MAEKIYRMPKKIPVQNVSGYPDNDVDLNDVRVKGRYMSDTKKKRLVKTRGTGAATKGTMFHDDPQDD